MTAPATPFNENARLAALHSYAILDTPPGESFDNLVSMAVDVIDAPIALITLVDRDRQWVKAKRGVDTIEPSRALSFCGHAILEEGVFEVSDSLEDCRFANNPLVRGEPNIRFYAGAPLVTPSGHKIGALCAIDQRPRTLSDAQREHLTLLAGQAMLLIQTEQNLREAYALAQKQQEIIADVRRRNGELQKFAYTASHDLRAPLNRMRRIAELSLDELGSEPHPVRDRLARIAANGTHLLGLVDGVLDLARGERRHTSLQGVELSAIAQNVAEDAAEQAAAGGVAVKLELPRPVRFRSDPVLLRQILANLVSNGIRYADPERADRFVAVGMKWLASGLELSVSDNGLGIPEQCQSRVFEMFERFHPTVHGGHGIGGALIKQAVKALDGTLTVESSREGTRIRVRLPDLRRGSR